MNKIIFTLIMQLIFIGGYYSLIENEKIIDPNLTTHKYIKKSDTLIMAFDSVNYTDNRMKSITHNHPMMSSGIAHKDSISSSYGLNITPVHGYVIYRGVETPFNISINKDIPGNLILSSKDFTINKAESGWIIKTINSKRISTISCSVKLDNDSINFLKDIAFQVVNIPKPIAFLGGKCNTDSYIRRSELQASMGVAARIMDVPHGRCRVINFTLTVIDNHTTELTSDSAYLTTEMKELLKKTKPGAKVIIEKINAKDPVGNEIKLGSIILEVK